MAAEIIFLGVFLNNNSVSWFLTRMWIFFELSSRQKKPNFTAESGRKRKKAVYVLTLWIK